MEWRVRVVASIMTSSQIGEDKQCFFSETSNWGQTTTDFVFQENTDESRLLGKQIYRKNSALNGTRALFISLFLPASFPNSVSVDYLPFQFWDSLQASSSYIRGIITTKAILSGVGVGNMYASSTSATMQWIFRDGCGMLGGLVFAWSRSTDFGVNVKQWRFFADISNDIGLTFELLSPMFPHYFLLLACMGSICRALCGVAAGATRAGILSHFSQGNQNVIADLSAKEGVQETAVTLFGMVVGYMISPYMSVGFQDVNKTLFTWIIFFILTIFHVFANFKAVKALQFRTLNVSRLQIVCEHFVEYETILTVSEVAVRENIIFPRITRIKLGSKLSDMVRREKHTVSTQLHLKTIISPNGELLEIAVSSNCSAIDIVKSILQAEYLKFHDCLANRENLKKSTAFAQQNIELFTSECRLAGWLLESVPTKYPNYFVFGQFNIFDKKHM